MGEDSSNRSLLRNPAGKIATASMLVTITYAVWVLGAWQDPRGDALAASLALILSHALLVGFGFYIVFQKDLGLSLRRAWAALTIGALSGLIGQILWLYYSSILGISDPSPSPADLYYTLYYGFTLIGALIFPLVFVPRKERSVLWLDLLIVVSFFGIIAWYFFLASPQFIFTPDTGGNWAFIYPLMDTTILAAIIVQVQRNLSKSARWILSFIAFAMVFSLVGDIIFAYYKVNDIAVGNDLAFRNIFWLCSAQAALIAAARQIASGAEILTDPPAGLSPFRYRFFLALPYLAVISGLGLLAAIVLSSLSTDPRLRGVMVGAYALVAIVLLRQFVVLQENIRLAQTMRRVAWTDSLTGLYNRHFFNEMLPREMERANRYKSQLSVLLLDLDGFKKYNDTYGHLQGDMVLKAVAHTFQTQLRSTDTIARFGGDEFVVILPETNRRKANMIAGRIKNAVANQSNFDVNLSVSIGVTSYRPGITPEGLLEEADKDLYNQKNSNRSNKENDFAPPKL